MTNARIEAAAAVLQAIEARERGEYPLTEFMEDAAAVLAAADAVTPVVSNEAQVEKIALVLSHADGWLSLAHPSPRHQAALRERARLILAALADT